ncbi:hypothetical protein [Methanosphaera sp. WGK6]|uniref:hypothetical protein n=1 Tax=Methanosphaera sp. WGK6 TaxID=1561964 RepID=UPI00084BC8C1|nr:hypothetical protein [Methanosphaera sp. WGK6]OED29692.1 hypothetical protein NL43_06810 [Methanosphaera sp. WGK6]
MNERGQLLIYDILLGMIILSLILFLSLSVLEDNIEVYDTVNDFEEPLNTMILLENTPYNNNYLLETLTYELNENVSCNKTLNKINEIISSNNKYNYTFSDITNNEILLLDTRQGSYKEVFSSRKIVNKHVFELKYYRK